MDKSGVQADSVQQAFNAISEAIPDIYFAPEAAAGVLKKSQAVEMLARHIDDAVARGDTPQQIDRAVGLKIDAIKSYFGL